MRYTKSHAYSELVLSQLIISDKLDTKAYSRIVQNINKFRFKFNFLLDIIKETLNVDSSDNELTVIIRVLDDTTKSASKLITNYFHICKKDLDKDELLEEQTKLQAFVTENYPLLDHFTRLISMITSINLIIIYTLFCINMLRVGINLFLLKPKFGDY